MADKIYQKRNGRLVEVAAGGGSSVTVDSALSAASANPVQNKAVASALSTKAADNAVVHLSGSETMTGRKKFNYVEGYKSDWTVIIASTAKTTITPRGKFEYLVVQCDTEISMDDSALPDKTDVFFFLRIANQHGYKITWAPSIKWPGCEGSAVTLKKAWHKTLLLAKDSWDWSAYWLPAMNQNSISELSIAAAMATKSYPAPQQITRVSFLMEGSIQCDLEGDIEEQGYAESFTFPAFEIEGPIESNRTYASEPFDLAEMLNENAWWGDGTEVKNAFMTGLEVSAQQIAVDFGSSTVKASTEEISDVIHYLWNNGWLYLPDTDGMGAGECAELNFSEECDSLMLQGDNDAYYPSATLKEVLPSLGDIIFRVCKDGDTAYHFEFAWMSPSHVKEGDPFIQVSQTLNSPGREESLVENLSLTPLLSHLDEKYAPKGAQYSLVYKDTLKTDMERISLSLPAITKKACRNVLVLLITPYDSTKQDVTFSPSNSESYAAYPSYTVADGISRGNGYGSCCAYSFRQNDGLTLVTGGVAPTTQYYEQVALAQPTLLLFNKLPADTVYSDTDKERIDPDLIDTVAIEASQNIFKKDTVIRVYAY